jgi:hypothetical protein
MDNTAYLSLSETMYLTELTQNLKIWKFILTGWLGKAVFFTPVAFTVLVDIIFYLTTGHAISQMSTYGRIHHKMKYR